LNRLVADVVKSVNHLRIILFGGEGREKREGRAICGTDAAVTP